MGLFFVYEKNSDFKLAIWKTDESVSELCKMLEINGDEIPSRAESRQTEWLAIRVLIKKLLGIQNIYDLEYDNHGKPRLKNNSTSISISHTKNFAGIIVSESPSCGIDLELIRPRIEKIAPRFLSNQETLFIEKEKMLYYLYVIWGVKEVLYKLYGKGNIIFKDDLKVDAFKFHSEGNVTAHISKENLFRSYIIHYKQLDELMLTYAIG